MLTIMPGAWMCLFLAALAGTSDAVRDITIPRRSLSITLKGAAVPVELGFTGWVATAPATGGKHVLAGELALLESEVNPVAAALEANGLEVTALAGRFLGEQPRIVFMHVRGYGEPDELARAVKPALDLVARAPAPGPVRGARLAGRLDTAKIAAIVGRQGEQAGAVYRIAAPREDLHVTDMGVRLTARMGFSSQAAFYGGDADAVAAGQVAAQAIEIAAVVKALAAHGLELTALYNHTAAAHPPVYFVHFQGRGPAAKLAAGFRAALDELTPPLRVAPLGR